MLCELTTSASGLSILLMATMIGTENKKKVMHIKVKLTQTLLIIVTGECFRASMSWPCPSDLPCASSACCIDS